MYHNATLLVVIVTLTQIAFLLYALPIHANHHVLLFMLLDNISTLVNAQLMPNVLLYHAILQVTNVFLQQIQLEVIAHSAQTALQESVN